MYDTATILEMISRQDFADFYGQDGPFERYISGDEKAPDKDEILAMLEKMLKRVKS